MGSEAFPAFVTPGFCAMQNFPTSPAVPCPSVMDAPNKLHNSCLLSHRLLWMQKTSVFSVPFPFFLVHLFTPLMIWLEAFKELIPDFRTDKAAPAERMTTTLSWGSAPSPASYSSWLSNHQTFILQVLGAFVETQTVKWAHPTLHGSDTIVICAQSHTDFQG